MSRLLAPRLDWSRYGRGPSLLSPNSQLDVRKRRNEHGLPLPTTLWQIIRARAEIRRDYEKKPEGMRRVQNELLRIVFCDSRPCPIYGPIAKLYCEKHLNGY